MGCYRHLSIVVMMLLNGYGADDDDVMPMTWSISIKDKQSISQTVILNEVTKTLFHAAIEISTFIHLQFLQITFRVFSIIFETQPMNTNGVSFPKKNAFIHPTNQPNEQIKKRCIANASTEWQHQSVIHATSIQENIIFFPMQFSCCNRWQPLNTNGLRNFFSAIISSWVAKTKHSILFCSSNIFAKVQRSLVGSGFMRS